MASQVFYMDGRSHSIQTGLVSKMLTVFEAAGLDKKIKRNDTVAIKLHCGEWNNSSYLRPVYARALADRIKELGGR
ncbi:MAG: 4Fe-4S ferredoxin, partial [Spirochaetales bacterium]|nr:4Fe-4S ferredoxin [Spirochaetales bacterium]